MAHLEDEAANDRPRGRPRNVAHDEVILAATLELVAKVGIAGLTVDAVAQRAGVGKATIYRRWNSKEALLLEAWHGCITIADVPDTGTLRGDLESYLDMKGRKVPDEAMKRIFPQLIAAAKVNPDVADTYKTFVEERRLPLKRLLDRAVERGELPASIDVGLIQDLLIGPLFYRRFISDGPTGEDVITQVLDIVLGGIQTTSAVTIGQFLQRQSNDGG